MQFFHLENFKKIPADKRGRTKTACHELGQNMVSEIYKCRKTFFICGF